MAAFMGRAPVAGAAFPLGDAFHHGRPEADVQWLAHQRVGHGVVVACDFDVVSNSDSGTLPRGILIGLCREGPEGRTVEGLKQRLAGAGEVFAGAGIPGAQAGSAGGMDRGQRKEGVVPQAGQHPAFHHVHAHFNLGLIPGLGRPGRDDRATRVLREVRVGPIERGCIAGGTGDGRFEVVGNDDLGNPAERRKGPPVRADPGRQALPPGGLSLGITGSP
jgi:hypothetical protein